MFFSYAAVAKSWHPEVITEGHLLFVLIRHVCSRIKDCNSDYLCFEALWICLVTFKLFVGEWGSADVSMMLAVGQAVCRQLDGQEHHPHIHRKVIKI